MDPLVPKTAVSSTKPFSIHAGRRIRSKDRPHMSRCNSRHTSYSTRCKLPPSVSQRIWSPWGAKAHEKLNRLSFFGPVYAIISLFTYILTSLDPSQWKSDLALLNVGAGHFARLELATGSEVSFAFPMELAVLARDFIRREREAPTRVPVASVAELNNEPVHSMLAGKLVLRDNNPSPCSGDQGNENREVSFLDRYCHPQLTIKN